MNSLCRRFVLAAAFLLFCTPASSQGVLNTFSCEDLPSPLQVRIDLLDDAVPMLKLRDRIVEALRRRGVAISADAPYVLSFEAEPVRHALRRKGRDLGSISDSTDEDVNFRMNLWSTQQDSIIGGRKDTIVSQAVDEMRLTISIHRVADGKCVWRGEGVHDTTDADQWRVANGIAPVLVDAIGMEAAKRTFDLK